MNLIPNFLAANNMILVFFINGLAFFVVGLAISLETRRPSKLKLVDSLWLLAVFAYLRSLDDWAEMFLLIQGQAAPASNNLPLQTAKALLLPLSCMFLLQFGIRTIIAANQRHLWLRWVPLALISFWLLALIQSIYSSSGAGAEWLLAADVWARYLLCLPGSALSGLAVFLHSRVLWEMKLPHIARNCIVAAVAFGLKAILAGLVVSPAPYFLASFLNESSFLAVVGMPVQVFRMIVTLAIAYCIVRSLEVFEIEQSRQLEVAAQQRFQAQQEALESQRQACEAIEQWSKQLEDMVNTIAMAISQPLELKEVLDIALRKTLELTGLEVGTVFLADDRAQELTLVAHQGLSQRHIQDLRRIKFGKGLVGRVASSGEPIVVENLSEDPRLISKVTKEEGIRYSASVPLKSKGRLLGIIGLASKSRRPLTPQEVTLLTAIGQQIGVAVENTRLYQQVRHLATVEERGRLAREIHDYLAQMVGYMNLKASIASERLSNGEIAEAQASLLELKQIAKETYTDVRETIFSLRTTASSGLELLPTLREYLAEYRAHYGVDARLVVDHESLAEYPADVGIQITCIIQEALTNVRKHAGASKAWVRFEQDSDRVRISVEDDGQGFDPAQVAGKGRQYFGLQIMRERAESVGGELELDSRPGQGTRVVIRVPLTPRG